MTTRATPAGDEAPPPEHPEPGHLHALPAPAAPPADDVILEQIRETVRRVTAASLRASSASDALISAEDIAQETMATLHVQRDREPPESLLAWALGVARLKLQAARRRSHRRGLPQPLAYADLADAARSDEQVLELLHYVWLLDQLAPLDRMIVQGRQAGYTSRELARELQHIGYPHLTANNVDQRFYRALKTLRRRLTAEQDAG
ncbi:MAG: sigma-70 family RNA polymerase sigma factor [Thermomicrobiales bacterium]